MGGWRGLYPVLGRGVGLFLGTLLLMKLASLLGRPVDWHTAILYGTALGVARRWPVIMPISGVQVILLGGLLFDAIWSNGIITAFAIILVEHGVMLISLHTVQRLWAWYRPVAMILMLGFTYLISSMVVVPQEMLIPGIRTDAAAFTLIFGYWLLLTFYWGVLLPGQQGSVAMVYHLIRKTWWVPVLHIMGAWLMALIGMVGHPLDVPVVLVLLSVQGLIGPIFTTLHQDRAVSRLLRLAPWQPPDRRATAQRVMRLAHSLGRMLHLSQDELRTLGYAALLQDALVAPDAPMPLWYPFPPTDEQAEAIRRYNASTVRRVREDGCLHEVAHLIQYRYATYDGNGVPDVAGEAIPLAAQVLSAANALVFLTSPEGRGLTCDQALVWIQTHAAGRYPRELLHAMLSTLTEGGAVVDSAPPLPATIRQLQGLKGEWEPGSLFRLGLRRAFMQLRSQAGLQPGLPEEVQAVARLSTIFAGSRDTDQTAQLFVRLVGELFGAKVGLALNDSGALDLSMRFRAAYDFRSVKLEGRLISIQGGMMSRVILSQEPAQLVDLQEASSTLAVEVARSEGVKSVLFMPLVSQGQSIGLLLVGLTHHHWFTPREVGLIQLMTDMATTALEKQRLMAEAEERVAHISDLKVFTDTLLDNLSQGILVVDPDGRLTLVNEAAVKLFGELGRKGQMLPDDLRRLLPLGPALAGQQVGETDLLWRSSVLSIHSAPLRGRSGEMLGVVITARDVTQVRAMEERVQRADRLAAIAELAAGAAHEIRNPLTSIRGFMQLLQAQGREGQAEYFQIIVSEIDRIDTIIRDLLLLARPARVQRVPVAVGAVLDEVLLMHQVARERQGIRLQVQVEQMGPALLDPNMLRQLLHNLLINAVQAMPHGGTLTVRVVRPNPEQVVLQITDTGVGIAPENIRRLFDPFFTTKEEGTGLGLALCHSIVQALGGHIEVESKPGAGTTFRVTLQAPVEQEAGLGA